MARMHRGCLLIGNLPRHWADEPEETVETLQEILPAPIRQNLCCIQVDPDQLHKAPGGLLTHLYVKIWMTTDQLEASVYSEITAIILGGVSVACQLYGAYCQTWTPLYPTGAGFKLRHESVHSTGRNAGGSVHGDQLPTTITSMWSDTDIFQAHLNSDDRIVLTTCPYNQKLSPPSEACRRQSKRGQSGTTPLCVGTRCGRQRPRVNIYQMFIKESRACLPTDG